jgi:hypothetical protein
MLDPMMDLTGLPCSVAKIPQQMQFRRGVEAEAGMIILVIVESAFL